MSDSKSVVFLTMNHWFSNLESDPIGKVTRLATGEAVLMMTATASQDITACCMGNQNRKIMYSRHSSSSGLRFPFPPQFGLELLRGKSDLGLLYLVPSSTENGTVLRQQMKKESITVSSHNCQPLSWQGRKVEVLQISERKSQCQKNENNICTLKSGSPNR